MNRRSVVWSLMLGLFACCLAGGCGKSGEATGTPVEGKILINGTPLKVNEDVEDVSLSFFKGEGEGQVGRAADLNPDDGTFTVLIPEAGTYKIAVESEAYGGADDEDEGKPGRFAKFASDVTPLSVELTTDPGQKLTIDLGKGTVTKQ